MSSTSRSLISTSLLSLHHNAEVDIAVQPITTFELFPTVITEVGVKVWKSAANFPRNVDIWKEDLGRFQNGADKRTATYHDVCRWFTTQVPPAVLLACKESRFVAEYFYYLDFGTGFRNHTTSLVRFSLTTSCRIRYNYLHDRICFMKYRNDLPPIIVQVVRLYRSFAVNIAYNEFLEFEFLRSCFGTITEETIGFAAGRELLLSYCASNIGDGA